MPFPDLDQPISNANNEEKPCSRDHMWEVFSPPRIGPVLRKMGGRCSRSIDCKNFWDLSKPDIQHCLLSDVATRKPFFLMLGPPCTMFGTLIFSNWFRMVKEAREERLREAVMLVDVSAWLCTMQAERGDYFALENPEGSQFWTRPNAPGLPRRMMLIHIAFKVLAWILSSQVRKLRDLKAEMVVFDQCVFGLCCPRGQAMRKPTVLLTNCPAIIKGFQNQRCKNDHEHISISGSLDGQQLSKWAQVYPAAMCQQIATCVMDQWAADGN